MKPKASARQWQLHGSGIETAIPQSQPRGDDTGQVPRPWGAWGVCRHAETAAMPQPVAAGPAKSVKIAAFPNSYLTIFMTEAHSAPPLPDHLSVDPRSPHHVAAVFEHDIGIRLNGKDRFDVEEYCISEGWVKVPAGKTLDRKGRPLLIKLKGQVEAFYRE